MEDKNNNNQSGSEMEGKSRKGGADENINKTNSADISNRDMQEGNMENGETGGNFQSPDEDNNLRFNNKKKTYGK